MNLLNINIMKQNNNYLSPSIKILRVESEKFFAQSNVEKTWNNGFISLNDKETNDMGIW